MGILLRRSSGAGRTAVGWAERSEAHARTWHAHSAYRYETQTAAHCLSPKGAQLDSQGRSPWNIDQQKTKALKGRHSNHQLRKERQ